MMTKQKQPDLVKTLIGEIGCHSAPRRGAEKRSPDGIRAPVEIYPVVTSTALSALEQLLIDLQHL